MNTSMLDWFLSTLTPTPTAESHMPSTAEIIQKCLSINPFDMKFREANMQINGTQSAEPSAAGALPTTPAGSTMLKLPSSLSQSPNIFSNVLSAADFGDDLRKTLDFTRKVQQLRDANLVKQEGNRTPCTADVLNAVLDMNMNQTLSIPSTSSLVAGLSAAAAAVATANSTAATTTIPAASTAATSAVADTTDSSTVIEMNKHLGFPFESNGTTDLASTTAAALLQQQQSNIATMISHQNALNALNTPANQSMPNLHSGATAGFPTSSESLLAPRASPALSHLSPRSTSNIMEIHKTIDNPRAASVDPWDSRPESKPMIGKPIPNFSMYEATHGRLELKTDSFNGSDGSSTSQPNSHVAESESKPHRKYTRYHTPSSNGSPTSGGRGRGRRSLTSEMPPDERRMTILERNKAAAVRYRKRKKEEHDEMIGRVHGLEQDKVYLQTQNSVLRREVERLTELLKLRDARCVCHNSQGMSLFNGDQNADIDKTAPNGDSNQFGLLPPQ